MKYFAVDEFLESYKKIFPKLVKSLKKPAVTTLKQHIYDFKS